MTPTKHFIRIIRKLRILSLKEFFYILQVQIIQIKGSVSQRVLQVQINTVFNQCNQRSILSVQYGPMSVGLLKISTRTNEPQISELRMERYSFILRILIIDICASLYQAFDSLLKSHRTCYRVRKSNIKYVKQVLVMTRIRNSEIKKSK